MRKPLIAGNWKMYGNRSWVSAFLNELIESVTRSLLTAELAIMPPFVYMSMVASALEGTTIRWGAQNVAEQSGGAYTGEVSATMLADFGCTYVIVGHSERRALYGDTNEIVSKKYQMAKSLQLTPILCIGETENERDERKTLKIIAEQLEAVFGLNDNLMALQGAVVAYEPVWAIGTGRQPKPEEVQTVHAFVRQWLAERSDQSDTVRLLYGGSVKPENARDLLLLPDVDGALVGGASLKVDQFLAIAEKCNNSY